MSALTTQNGRTLNELSREKPTLVVFLRHSGCPFCRETLAEIAFKREAIERTGAQIAIVHMMTDADAASFFDGYGLADLSRISDPEQQLYKEFNLQRGTALQVMGPSVWWAGFKTTLLKGHLFGKPQGDVFQLPGAFLLVDGKIINSFRPATSAEQPDYVDLATCPR